MDWNFGDLLDATAVAVPGDRPALIRGERMVCWAEFDARTNNLARAMRAAGFAPGARIAILARNIPEFIEIAAAAFKARLAHVNLNYRYTTSELDYVLADCAASALFYETGFADAVAPIFERNSHLRMNVAIGGAGAPGSLAYETLAETGDGSPLGIARSPDDYYLVYTGGTTGHPKGVMWRSADARAVQLESPLIKAPARTMADHVAQVTANPAPGRVLPACPLMHGAGLNSSLAELVNGGTVVLLTSSSFDAAELWGEVERCGVTRILIVGDVFARPMARALDENPGRWALGSLRAISSAGLMWSDEAKQALIRNLPDVVLVDILGASEASGFGYSITNRAQRMPTGLFLPGPGTAIIDVETDRVLGADEPGAGWLARTPPFASGYYGDEAKTAATYREIGGTLYAIPGDMAERDPKGRIRLIGRGSMCINTGGEKVFPEEVEEALKLAPGIEDAMVAGVPDAMWGSAVAALILRGAGYDEAAVRAQLQQRLAAYKIPKHIVPVEELPRHASGKGDYRRAAEMLTSALAPPSHS